MIAGSIEVYTDGSSLNNPGRAGYGYIIRYWTDNNYAIEQNLQVNQGFERSTNNRMELKAIIESLKRIISEVDSKNFEGLNQIDIYSDSKYIINAINAGWLRKWQTTGWLTSGYNGKGPSPVKNQDLWKEFLTMEDELRKRQIKYTITFVKGHDGFKWNEAADKLATAASNNGPYIIDEGFEHSSKY